MKTDCTSVRQESISVYDWAIQFRAIASVLKKYDLIEVGRVTIFFTHGWGKVTNFFLVFKGRVRIFWEPFLKYW